MDWLVEILIQGSISRIRLEKYDTRLPSQALLTDIRQSAAYFESVIPLARCIALEIGADLLRRLRNRNREGIVFFACVLPQPASAGKGARRQSGGVGPRANLHMPRRAV
jgi:hypothetical protein